MPHLPTTSAPDTGRPVPTGSFLPDGLAVLAAMAVLAAAALDAAGVWPGAAVLLRLAAPERAWPDELTLDGGPPSLLLAAETAAGPDSPAGQAGAALDCAWTLALD